MNDYEKVCLVTGGSRGIGKGIVEVLASSGYQVAFTYRVNKSISEKFMEEQNRQGLKTFTTEMDITDRNSIKRGLNQVQTFFKKPVSILVNNAAIAQEKPFSNITDQDWEAMLRTNLQGPFMIVQEVLPDLIRNKFGRIVNITSVGGQWGGFNQVHYASSKAALINFTQSIAKIYSRDGITSNAVAIGLAKTDMSGAELESEEGKEKVANIPVGRVGTIQEIAHTVKFLISEEASYITGQTINVNGGMYFG